MAGFRPTTVLEFLQYCDLSRHVTLLHGQGYRDIVDVFLLTEDDLDSVHIKTIDERLAILSAVDNIDISAWLDCHGLSMYEQFFRTHHIQTVGELKKTRMTEDLMDELEVMVPGDRKRLSMAASHICVPSNDEDSTFAHGSASEATCSEFGDPMSMTAAAQAVGSTSEATDTALEGPLALQHSPVQAFGYWGKNDKMLTKNNVLWVECAVSNMSGEDSVTIFCMVDSGSEVMTCEKHIVTRLGLEFIKTIDSKGIHKIEKKPLYKGTLTLGNRQLEVEIMPDSYNSVGCDVISKFSHFITTQRHIWFG